MSKRIRLRDRLAALEHLVEDGGGTSGDTGGGGGTGGLDTAAVEAIVDQKIADLPAPSGGGGGGAETGMVLPIEAATTFTVDSLPAADNYEVFLDGVLTSADLPSPAGYLSWAKATVDGRVGMAINPTNNGQTIDTSGYPYITTPITQAEFLTKTLSGGHLSSPYPGGGIWVMEWNNAGTPGGWGNPWDVPAIPGIDMHDPLAVWNKLLADRGFAAWPDLNHPVEALSAAPKNITLRPNGSTTGTHSIASGSDGGAPESVNLESEGLLLARAWTGPSWRVLATSRLSAKQGSKRISSGVSTAAASAT